MENTSLLNRSLSVQNFMAYDHKSQFPLASEIWKTTCHHVFPILAKSQVINCQPIKVQPRGKRIIKSFNCP